MRCWYNKGQYDKNKVENIAIRCTNCGKETGLSIKNMNANFKYIITLFVLNAVLYHNGMSWIIETNKNLECDMKKKSRLYDRWSLV